MWKGQEPGSPGGTRTQRRASVRLTVLGKRPWGAPPAGLRHHWVQSPRARALQHTTWGQTHSALQAQGHRRQPSRG